MNINYILFYLQLTPVGLTVFRGIHAIDRDKPNTPNSDVTYSIVVCFLILLEYQCFSYMNVQLIKVILMYITNV